MKQDQQGSEEVPDSRVPEGTWVTRDHLGQQDSRVLQDLTELQEPAAKRV